MIREFDEDSQVFRGSGPAPVAGRNEAGPRWVVREGCGRAAVVLIAREQGRDLLVQVGGGEVHAGAVAVYAAAGGTPGEDPVTTTVLPGHKEGPLAAECASALGRATGRSCVVVAGIHQDRITPREIAAVLENVRTGTSRLAELVTARQSGSRSPSVNSTDVIEERMIEWCAEAAAIALHYWRNTGDLEFKHGHEAVTEADRRIETMIRERIRSEFPGDGIVGEEFGSDGPTGAAGRIWHIDPIDGTLNFALGLPGFCTSLALVEDGAILAACVHVPTTGDSFTAGAGRGARLNGQPIRVSTRAPLAEAIVSTQFKKDARYVQDPQLLQALHERTFRLRRTGAIALELAWVAAGSYDALLANFRRGIQPYDVAAGLLLIREAGGTITDHEGRPYPLGGADLVVSNGGIHGELIGLIEQSGRPSD